MEGAFDGEVGAAVPAVQEHGGWGGQERVEECVAVGGADEGLVRVRGVAVELDGVGGGEGEWGGGVEEEGEGA